MQHTAEAVPEATDTAPHLAACDEFERHDQAAANELDEFEKQPEPRVQVSCNQSP